MTESVEGGLILQQKWEDLSVYLFSCVLRDMPKNDRFTLGADIRATVWEVEAALGVPVQPVDAESGFELVDAMLGLGEPSEPPENLPPEDGEYYRYNPPARR